LTIVISVRIAARGRNCRNLWHSRSA